MPNTRKHELTNTADILDSRDVIARIEVLQAEREDLDADDTIEWDADYGDELTALVALQNDAEGYDEWSDGTAVDSGFVFHGIRGTTRGGHRRD